MLKKFLIAWSALALKSASLFALIHPQPPCARFAIQGEYLYWLPDVDDTYFVIQGTIPPFNTIINGEIKNAAFGFDSGYRLEGAYAFDDLFNGHIRYAKLDTDTGRRYTGYDLWQVQGGDNENISPIIGFMGNAEAQLSLNYKNAEILFSSKFSNGNKFSLFGGLQYFSLKLQELYYYAQINFGKFTSRVTQSTKAQGLGPEFGFDFFSPLSFLGDELSVIGQFSGSLLATRSKLHYTSTVTTQTEVFPWQNSRVNNLRIVPALNARAGLQYASTFYSLRYFLQIGYEFTTYLRGVSRVDNPTGDGYYELQYSNLDLQGLYVALGLNF